MSLANNAIFWMLLTGFISVVITVIAKDLGGAYHPFQIMFFYCSFGALFLAPAVIVHYGCNKNSLNLSTIRWRYHGMRSVLEFIGFSLTFYALIKLPLPMATAINYTLPLFATLFAIIFVGEHMNRRVALSLLLGMVGVCIIHNPFTADITSGESLGIAAGLGAAIAFSLCGSLIKLSTRTTPPLLIAMIMLVFTTLVTTPFALSQWQAISKEHLASLCLLGLSVASVQYAVSRALSLGMISRLIPLSYLNLVWASLFAYFLFDELIEPRTIYGSLFIFGAVMCVSMGGKTQSDTKEVSQETSQP